MEKQSDQVRLSGMWASGFCTRVKLALKLKGIPFEYVEEDLSDNCEVLIQRNPVYEKIPVLVHNGRSIAGSLAILEYIDEHWNNPPKLLPEDPCEREKVQVWAKFFDQKLKRSAYNILISQGKGHIKAIEEFIAVAEAFEKGIQKDFPTKSPFTNEETLGFLDIVVGSSACNHKAFTEAIDLGLNYSEICPSVCSWVAAMIDFPLMKETLPPHDQLVAKLRDLFGLKPAPKVLYYGK